MASCKPATTKRLMLMAWPPGLGPASWASPHSHYQAAHGKPKLLMCSWVLDPGIITIPISIQQLTQYEQLKMFVFVCVLGCAIRCCYPWCCTPQCSAPGLAHSSAVCMFRWQLVVSCLPVHTNQAKTSKHRVLRSKTCYKQLVLVVLCTITQTTQIRSLSCKHTCLLYMFAWYLS